MKPSFIIVLINIIFLGCISAPEYDRDNINDLSSGSPFINNFSYTLNQMGLTLNWIDGSIQNDVYIIEQKMYDNSENQLDSLIKIIELDEDATSYYDGSRNFGFPYTVFIKSRILDGDRIQTETIDTLNIEFGKLSYRSQFISDDQLILNWQNIPNFFYSDSVLVESYSGGMWQTIALIEPRAQSFSIPTSLLIGDDRFRISSTVRNYNNRLSRASSFEVEVD